MADAPGAAGPGPGTAPAGSPGTGAPPAGQVGPGTPADPDLAVLWTAAALGLAAAVSLGLARFAYALLLPPMRQALGWSYFTAGALNTVNAAGYLLGALLAPRVLARVDARSVMLAGGLGAAMLVAAHGLVPLLGPLLGLPAAGLLPALYALRLATGVASAASFIGGGLLAARLATRGGVQPGLVLGLYYGGTGVGICTSALAVPLLPWAPAWCLLGLLAGLATVVTARGTRGLVAPPASLPPRQALGLRPYAFGLAGYACFGLGYIGTMTFIVSLLRERGASGAEVTAFYTLLGAGVMASSWLWAGLLQRHRNGVPLALLNGLLALATVLPVVSRHPVLVYASGLLFGSVFLSVVASTTALVRHNAPPAAWASGISAFTIVFAAGQIVGPSLVGRVADGPGGLAQGLAISAGLLALGSLLALGQRAVPGALAQR